MSQQTALEFQTIRELGKRLRSGDTTPVELTRYFIDRLDTIGRELNAVVTLTPERAIREAQLAEEELAAGYDRGPLHGIPYGAKDLLATAGIPTTWGAVPLRNQIFAEDAKVIQKLRNSGAVLIAKLSMVELAGGMGYNQPNASITGPGINPWNRNAWSGGSSSGSGSAVGAGAIPFGIGSETQGSILSPAGYCGVTGLRPTYGRVSRRGAMALSWTLDKLGPLCLNADDAGLVTEAIAGPDAQEPTTIDDPYRYRPERERHSGFRIAVLRDGVDDMQPAVRDNFERSLMEMSPLGSLEDIELPDFPYPEVARIIISSEGASALEDLIVSGKTAELTAPECRIGGFPGMTIPAVDYLRAMRIRQKLSVEIHRLFSRYDAVVHPTMGTVASPLDVPFNDYVGKASASQLTAAGNLAGLPAISVPNGFGERGLPTGIQFVGRAGAENQILAVANAFQRHTDWHTRHPEKRD